MIVTWNPEKFNLKKINQFLDAIKQMLNLNQPLTKTLAAEPVWKILIYDRVGQDIISPLLTVQELRDIGCTLHLLVFL